jgi:hypothetical protein
VSSPSIHSKYLPTRETSGLVNIGGITQQAAYCYVSKFVRELPGDRAMTNSEIIEQAMKFYLEFNVKVDEMLTKAKMQDGLVWYYTRW